MDEYTATALKAVLRSNVLTRKSRTARIGAYAMISERIFSRARGSPEVPFDSKKFTRRVIRARIMADLMPISRKVIVHHSGQCFFGLPLLIPKKDLISILFLLKTWRKVIEYFLDNYYSLSVASPSYDDLRTTKQTIRNMEKRIADQANVAGYLTFNTQYVGAMGNAFRAYLTSIFGPEKMIAINNEISQAMGYIQDFYSLDARPCLTH